MMKTILIGALLCLICLQSPQDVVTLARKPIIAETLPTEGVIIAVSDTDVSCLAKNIYHEARGEPIQGQIAVAAVTMNRVASAKFPDSVCGVVYQPKQFSWVRQKDNHMGKGDSWRLAHEIARDYLMGLHKDPTNGSKFFHVKHNDYGWKRRRTVIIGNHQFYM
jgi:N-acetylmuramoyl-L-alanine amidase